MLKPSTLKLSIIGCGGIANPFAGLARKTRRIDLVACCDKSPERAAAFAKKHKIKQVFTDYRELIRKTDSTAVYLATPHDLHFPMIRYGLDAGKHIFTEKPITRTLAEGREIVAYAQEKGLKIGVNYQNRYDPGCYALARATQAAALGRVLYARINVPWHRERSYFDDSPWHQTIAQAGGATLITQASHFIDIALWAIGSRPISAMGYTTRAIFTGIEVEDLAQATIELENGALLQVCSSMVAATEQAVTIEIYGERGTAIYSDKPRPSVKFIGIKSQKVKPPYFGLHALHRSIKGFRDWVLYDQPYLIPGEEALSVLQVVEAIYKSAQSEKREYIETADGRG
jgi:UDP-N-acetyl-2-amino-2-deoxyglucuronate dehydrogenase